MGKLYSYYKNDLIMRDSYSRKYQEIGNNSEYDLLDILQNKKQVLSMSDTHMCNDMKKCKLTEDEVYELILKNK